LTVNPFKRLNFSLWKVRGSFLPLALGVLGVFFVRLAVKGGLPFLPRRTLRRRKGREKAGIRSERSGDPDKRGKYPNPEIIMIRFVRVSSNKLNILFVPDT
jgi:hypothetical protein